MYPRIVKKSKIFINSKTNKIITFIPQRNLKTLPFVITRQDAEKILLEKKQNIFQNNAKTMALSLYRGDPIKECYIPFHAFDIRNLKSGYQAQIGYDKIEKYVTIDYIYRGKYGYLMPVEKIRHYIEWHNVSGISPSQDYPFGGKNIYKWSQVYADFIYPRHIMEDALHVGSMNEMVELTPDMLMKEDDNENKRILHGHEMNLAFALEKINSRLYNVEGERIKEYLLKKYSANHVNITLLNINLDQANIIIHSFYVPAYIQYSKFKSLSKYKIINAYNGKMAQNPINSMFKSITLGSVTGAIITITATMMLQPFILPLELAACTIVGSAFSGFLGGTFSKWHNNWKDNTYKQEMVNEKKLNSCYRKNDDDIRINNFSEYINNEIRMVDKKIYPTNKLKLLQINPNTKNITIDIIKNAYISQSKKWHPDLHNDNKELAHQMMTQINLAYKELILIFELQNQNKK